MLSLGRIGVALGVAVFVSREIERKFRQRRNDPVGYRDTPAAYAAGGIVGALVLAVTAARDQDA